MDARKVHELFLSQTKQNPGGTTPVNQKISFQKSPNSLIQNPKPVQTKSNIDPKKILKTAFWTGGILLVVYLLTSKPKNDNYISSRQRRKQRKKESTDKDTMREKSIPGIKPSNDYPTL